MPAGRAWANFALATAGTLGYPVRPYKLLISREKAVEAFARLAPYTFLPGVRT